GGLELGRDRLRAPLGEVPGELPLPRGDGCLDRGSRDHQAVQHEDQLLPTGEVVRSAKLNADPVVQRASLPLSSSQCQAGLRPMGWLISSVPLVGSTPFATRRTYET